MNREIVKQIYRTLIRRSIRDLKTPQRSPEAQAYFLSEQFERDVECAGWPADTVDTLRAVCECSQIQTKFLADQLLRVLVVKKSPSMQRG